MIEYVPPAPVAALLEPPVPSVHGLAPTPVTEYIAQAHAAPSYLQFSTGLVNLQFSTTCVEVSAPESTRTVLEQVRIGNILAPPIVDDTIEVQIPEPIHEQTVPGRIEDLIEERFNVEDTTLNTVGTSSSSSTSSRCGELANMLDSCIQLLSPLVAHVESIEKETEGVAMLTKRMLEPPLMEPPLIEPPMMESERASAKRRR